MHSFNTSRGMTLIEIMVAVGLSVFVLSGILKVISNSSALHKINDAVSQVQQEGRFGMRELSQALHYRGYRGCIPPIELDPKKITPIEKWSNQRITNPVASYLGSDNLAKEALRGFSVSEKGSIIPAINDKLDFNIKDIKALLQDNKTHGKLKPGSSIISLQYASPEFVSISKNMTHLKDDIEIESNHMGFQIKDLVFVGDCLASDVFSISNPISLKKNQKAVLKHVKGNESDQLQNTYSKSAAVRKFYSTIFFVAQTNRKLPDGKALYALYKKVNQSDAVEIVEGVEHFTVLYGHRTPSSGNNNLRYTNVLKNINSNFFRQVETIQLGLLIQGINPIQNGNDTSSYTVLNDKVEPNGSQNGLSHSGGRYHRQVFEKTVLLRNRS